jgi:hypothetical protein
VPKELILSNFIITMTGLVKLIDGLVGDGAGDENEAFCMIRNFQKLVRSLLKYTQTKAKNPLQSFSTVSIHWKCG